MAFTKIASPSDWPTMKIDAPTCTVKISSRGLMPVDAATLSKLAGDQFVDAVKKMEGELRKDCQYVHAVSCGASDYFGPNRNADGWRAEVLERDMPTYVKHAKLFREHVNRKDSPYYGRIKLAFYDKERGYGRVLAEYNATKKAADELGGLVADKELEKLAKDGHICVSHGTTVGSDVCTHCGNVATKKAEYCLPKSEGGTCTLFGCRHGMSKVAEDGRTQYVDNPKNVFYDLSFVGTPADRIAFGLGVKTASLSDVVYEPRYDLLGLDAYSDFDTKIVKAALDLAAYEAKYAINDVGNDDLHKLAAFNSVLGDPKQKVSLDGLVHPDPYVKRGAAHTLAKNKQLPSAGKMAKAAGFSDPDAAICDAISVGLIERLVSQDKLAALLDSSDFTRGRLAANSHFYAICASAPGYSFDSDSLTKRAHLEAISESTVYKFPEIPVQVDPGLIRMACDHAALKIAMVAQFFPDDEDTLTLFACPRRS